VALLLRKKGVKRIRPLEGGLDAWRELGYPLQMMQVSMVTEPTSKA
jgi:3-mercaptopyruvate sulfurtransferase SseA